MTWTRLDQRCAASMCIYCGGSGFYEEYKICGACESSGLKGGRNTAQQILQDYKRNKKYYDKIISDGCEK